LDHGILSSHLEILKFGEFIRDFDGVLLAGMIPVRERLDLVTSGDQETPIFSSLGAGDVLIDTFDDDIGVRHWFLGALF